MRQGRRGTRASFAAPALGVVLLAALTLMAIAFDRATAWTPPTPAQVRAAYRPSDARLEARDGRVLHSIRIDLSRRQLEWTSLPEISPALIRAVLASEDRRFHEHPGVDMRSLASAVWQRVRHGVRRGASTVTMQLVALVDSSLRPSAGRRTPWEKLHQIRAALALEELWSKEQILEAYLNLVPFRSEIVGVRAATETLLAKDPHGVNAAEAAILAALLRRPSASREVVVRRAARLAPHGKAADLNRAAGAIFTPPTRRGPIVRDAPHLARRLLGSGKAVSVRSTLDADLQRYAAHALEEEVGSVRRRGVRDGALVVLDNATGDVLAYVGGSGRHATAPYVDGTQARRQAGSTLKPFLYALALERRLLTPASLLDDSPLEVPVDGRAYRPRNYDDSFRGLVPLRVALASSLNIPAVRTQRLVGEPAFVALLERLGFTQLVRTGDHYGPSLTLGTPDVTLLELATAYRALAQHGTWTATRVRSNDAPAEERAVLSPAVSFLITDILSDRDARSSTFGLENPLATRFWTAAKTGTSKDMRDNWCVGFSSEFTVAVWVGNHSGAPMHEVSGVTGAAPVWQRVMSYLHRDRPSHAPSPPRGVRGREIAIAAGPLRHEWFLTGTEPATRSVRPSRPPPSIAAPADGARLALDPSIPADRQSLALVATPSSPDLRWRLDGEPLGDAASPFLWPLRAGAHDLRLLDRAGATVDRVRFFVRSGS